MDCTAYQNLLETQRWAAQQALSACGLTPAGIDVLLVKDQQILDILAAYTTARLAAYQAHVDADQLAWLEEQGGML